jgi:FG-GAP repeat
MRIRWSGPAALAAMAMVFTTATILPSQGDGGVRTAATRAALPSDFNGDGVEDLAIGVPGDSPSGWQEVGGVHIRYGQDASSSRLSSRYFSVDSPGLAPLLRQFPTHLGNRLASGDFDRDGFADLAMSVPGFDEPDPALQRINVGAVVVVYGTATGLMPRGDQKAQVWSQDSPGVQGVSEDDDRFGSSLAVGDFDGDGFLDLAVGADGETSGPGLRHSGSLTVLYGGRAGLTGRDQVVSQDFRGILDASEAGDWAAGAMVAGDFDGDAVDDLAMGVDAEDIDGRRNVGAVNVIYGTRGVGLTGAGDRFAHQGLEAIPGEARGNDRFGTVLNVGDFNGDLVDDLAIAAPEENRNGWADIGSVTTVYGSPTGLAWGAGRIVTVAGLSDFDADGNTPRFGGALASGDVNNDGYDELAVGSPTFSLRAGRVDLLPGSADGLGAQSIQTFSAQDFDTPGLIPGTQTFGQALQFGAFDTTPGADLIVGMPRAQLLVNGQQRCDWAGGAVLVFARSGQLSLAESRWLRQGGGVFDATPEEADTFAEAFPGSYDYNL